MSDAAVSAYLFAPALKTQILIMQFQSNNSRPENEF